MSILSRVFGRQEKSADTLEIFRELYGSPPAHSGQSVSWKTALNITTVLACVRVKANGISQVPLKLMRELPDGTRQPATDHPLYDVLHRRPNPWQTSFEFRSTLEFHRELCGNAYCFINRVGGRVVELIPIEPMYVTVAQSADHGLSYTVSPPNGTPQSFPAEAIWHLKGPSWNGWFGMETVRQAREAIGLAMATEEQHARLHKHGVSTSGLMSVDGNLDPEAYKRLRAALEQQHAGSANAGKAMIMDRGARWTPMGMSGVDAQHLETRKFQIEEICRAFDVYPQMIGHSDKTSTYASAEQFFLAHVVHKMGPVYEAWEQSIDCNLLSVADRNAGLYAKFNVNAMLRGAMSDRADFYTKLYGVGALSPNEIRALEELNPYDGGDQHRVPLNMVDPNAPPPEPTAPKELP